MRGGTFYLVRAWADLGYICYVYWNNLFGRFQFDESGGSLFCVVCV